MNIQETIEAIDKALITMAHPIATIEDILKQIDCPSCEKLRAENAELKWKIAEQKQNNEQVDYKYHDRD